MGESSGNLVKLVVGILLLFGLLYPSAAKMAVLSEPFVSGIAVTDPSLRKTGAGLYLENPSLFCSLSQTFDAAITDHKDILLYRTCVGIKDPHRNFESMMSNYVKTLSYLISKQTLRTNNFNDVTQRIREVLESIRLSNGTEHKLKGPFYVLMFQAPYYRDERTGSNGANQVIHVQPFNVNEYGYSSSIILKDIVDKQPLWSMEPDDGVQFVFYIMCPMYDPANKMRVLTPRSAKTSIDQCVGYWLKQATGTNMCKMKCPNNDGYTCGCLNTSQPYESVCLGPSDKKDLQKKEYINYGSLYRVHESHPIMGPMFDEKAFHRDGCTVPK